MSRRGEVPSLFAEINQTDEYARRLCGPVGPQTASVRQQSRG